MAKVSRSVLKDLVKECLVEILSEGLSQKNENRTIGLDRNEAKATKRAPVTRSPVHDLMTMKQPAPKKKGPSPMMEQRIKANSGGNSVMESILRDTAKNTLPTMIAAESRNPGMLSGRMTPNSDAAAKIVAENDPMDIFEGASNWAAVAFANKK